MKTSFLSRTHPVRRSLALALLIAGPLAGASALPALAQSASSGAMPERPSVEAWRAMSEAERRAFREEMRAHVQGLSPEEREAFREQRAAEMQVRRAEAVEMGAKLLAARDSLPPEERQQIEDVRAEMQARAESVWSGLSESEKASYRAQAEERIGERLEERRARRGERGAGDNPFGQSFTE